MLQKKENPARGGAVLLGGSNSSEHNQSNSSFQQVGEMLARRSALRVRLDGDIAIADAMGNRLREIYRDFDRLRLTPDQAEAAADDVWNCTPAVERSSELWKADLIRQWEAGDRRDQRRAAR